LFDFPQNIWERLVIEITNLEKRYPSPDGAPATVLVVDSLTIAPAEQLALVGPSGSGKSTILAMIGGILAPSAGTLRWNGAPWPDADGVLSARERARRVGFVFQELNLLPSLSLRDNLGAAAWFLGLQAEEKSVRQALERVGLSGRAGHKPGQLSRGERQRAAVARAALHPHELIIADEPTASLDEANAKLVMDLLVGMASDNGSALLVATHDPRVIAALPRTFDLLEHRPADGDGGGTRKGAGGS
jgi:putative ABC transport system ATP-binding protein